jgi:Zn-dependent protease with chaperone function
MGTIVGVIWILTEDRPTLMNIPHEAFAAAPREQPRNAFPLISSEAFISQTDKVALQNLNKIPLLPTVLRKFNELAWDRISYTRNTAESVRCGPDQFPTLYKMMQEACRIMEITEPELYVRYSEAINAYTSGTNKTFIVLHSELVNHFTDDELLFIIGHEVGHIKCGHVLYQEMGRVLLPLLEALGQATLGLGQVAGIALVSGFYEWMRQAEYTCDRAGLLVCQDPRVALSALMKLGCGSTRYNHELDLDTFLLQARDHAESGGAQGISKALLFIMYNWQLSHPQVVYRTKGLDDWINSGAYDRILSGDYVRDATGGTALGQQVRCPGCRKNLPGNLKFCPHCGMTQNGVSPNAPTAQTIPCGACGAVLPAGVKFCVDCGSMVAAV